MPRRQRSSWGCVTRLGPGRFRLRWPEWDGTKRVRRTKVMRCTRREADAELARLRVRLETPADERPCPTFGEVWAEWYAPEMEARIADGSLTTRTRNMYAGLWKRHVSQRWAGIAMDTVMPSDYQAWLLTLTASNGHHSDVLVGNLVNSAKRHGVRGIEFKDVSYRLSTKSVAKRVDDVYKLEELVVLCKTACGTVCEVPAILAAFASCRTGEACAPMLSDVSDAVTPWGRVAIIRIDKQLTTSGATISPKTAQSVRSVIVPEPWATRVLDIAHERSRAGLVWLNDNGCGEPVPRNTVSDSWRRVVESAGARYLPLTKLRNSWETMSRWMLGIDKDLIDKMMGHTSNDVRSKHYDRPDEDMFAETVARAWSDYAKKR